MKLKTISRVVIGVSALTASLSSFALDVDLPLPLNGGNVLFSDNSAEYLINCTPGTPGCESTAGDFTVDVGDRLHGIFLIDDISGVGILAGNPAGSDELSGVFDVTVTSKSTFINGFGLSEDAFEFGVTPSFATDLGLSAGSAMAWYIDPNHEFAREAAIGSGETRSSLESLVTNGDLLWSTGFSGDAFWNASVPQGAGGIGAGNIAGGQFAMGLNYLDNLSGIGFGQVSCADATSGLVSVDQCANGGLLTPNPAGGNFTPFQVWDDVNFNSVIVPVPAAAWLFGSALLGLVGVSRRKKG